MYRQGHQVVTNIIFTVVFLCKVLKTSFVELENAYDMTWSLLHPITIYSLSVYVYIRRSHGGEGE